MRLWVTGFSLGFRYLFRGRQSGSWDARDLARHWETLRQLQARRSTNWRGKGTCQWFSGGSSGCWDLCAYSCNGNHLSWTSCFHFFELFFEKTHLKKNKFQKKKREENSRKRAKPWDGSTQRDERGANRTDEWRSWSGWVVLAGLEQIRDKTTRCFLLWE